MYYIYSIRYYESTECEPSQFGSCKTIEQASKGTRNESMAHKHNLDYSCKSTTYPLLVVPKNSFCKTVTTSMCCYTVFVGVDVVIVFLVVVVVVVVVFVVVVTDVILYFWISLYILLNYSGRRPVILTSLNRIMYFNRRDD